MSLVPFRSVTYDKTIYINPEHVVFVIDYQGGNSQVATTAPANNPPFILYVEGDADTVRKHLNNAMSR